MKLSEIRNIFFALVRTLRYYNLPELASAFAFYAFFLIPPFFAVVLTVISMLFGSVLKRADVLSWLTVVAGAKPASELTAFISAYSIPAFTIPTLVIASFALIFAGSQIYLDLRISFNKIWGVVRKERPTLILLIKERFGSFLFVTSFSLIFIAMITASTMIMVFNPRFSSYFDVPNIILQLINLGVTFVVITFIFSILYSQVADVSIHWRHALPGAAIISGMFIIGNYLLSLYLQNVPVYASIYGIFGTIVVILVWTYYASLLTFIGVFITKKFVNSHGGPVSLSSQYHFAARSERVNKILRKVSRKIKAISK